METPTDFARFLERYPEYRSTAHLDDLRAAEYARLDGHTYLDYTGASLYADAQVREHLGLLGTRLFGNPHSASPASSETTTLVERTRGAVLDWFNAGDDYTAVFTLNASGALKHVAESYPFAAGTRLLLTADNHNSVNGIREFAHARGAAVEYVPLTFPELRVDEEALRGRLSSDAATSASTAETTEQRPEPTGASRAAGLFVFPAQSNFSGVQHPLRLVDEAQTRGWHVLLDAAAFVPTSRLDLRVVRPEFAVVSFYKMFGYPTGVGCLLVRRDAIGLLRRPWFAGGTVDFATVRGARHILSAGEAGFEDGTLNFLSIPAVGIGLRHLAAAGIEAIHTRVGCLTGWLLGELVGLAHANGRPLVRIYGPLTTTSRGAIVTMNFYDPDGHLLDYRRVEELAGERRISLRTGCFCNPGAGETAEDITEDDIAAAVATGEGMTLPRFLQFITGRAGKSAGAIRVSFGIASNFDDARRFRDFAAGLRDQTRLAIGEATFDIAGCRVIRDGS